MGSFKGRLRQRGGVIEKLCTGPLHREGKWIPITEYYLRSRPAGDRVRRVPRAECKACSNHYTHVRYQHVEQNGLVPIKGPVVTAMGVLAERIGKAETCRRLGVSPAYWWRMKRQKSVRKDTAAKLIRLAYEVMKSGEVRSRKEIHHGTYARRLNGNTGATNGDVPQAPRPGDDGANGGSARPRSGTRDLQTPPA